MLLRHLLRGCLVTVLCLGLAELTLRFLLPEDHLRPPVPRPENVWRGLLHRPSPVPGLTYELRPDAEQFFEGALIRTNSLGMRDAEPRAAAEAPVRIATIGDSVTFGFGVSAESAYPSLLERLLDEGRSSESPPYDVLNFGVSGYSTRQQAFVVEHRALPWSPETIVIGYVLNDPETEPMSVLQRHFMEVSWWQHSNLLRLVARVKHERDVRRLGGGDYFRYLHEHPEKWNSVVAAFQRIRDLVADSGTEVVVAIFPALDLKGSSWEDYRYSDVHARVAAEARRNGFLVEDLLPVCVASGRDPFDLRVSERDPHPNEHCHRLAAEALRDRLLRD